MSETDRDAFAAGRPFVGSGRAPEALPERAGRLALRLLRGGASRASLAVVAFGIDRFETISRLHGTDVGEAIRVEIERRLRARLPRGSRLKRVGSHGLELVVRLAPAEDPRRLAESLRLAAVAAPITVRGVYHLVGMTDGVVRRRFGEAATVSLREIERLRDRAGPDGANRVHVLAPAPVRGAGA